MLLNFSGGFLEALGKALSFNRFSPFLYVLGGFAMPVWLASSGVSNVIEDQACRLLLIAKAGVGLLLAQAITLSVTWKWGLCFESAELPEPMPLSLGLSSGAGEK